MKFPLFVVFDLDGTLADDSHRHHFIDRPNADKDWPAYFGACAKDEPIEPMIAIARALYDAGHTVEIWTGRSAVVRDETVSWLAVHCVGYHLIRMRPAMNHRPQTELMTAWLEEASRKPDLAVDDNMTEVRWWRSLGVTTLAVAETEYGS